MKRIVPWVILVAGAAMAFFVLVPKVSSTDRYGFNWRSRNPEIAVLQDTLEWRQDTVRTLIAVRERLLALDAARSIRGSTASLTFSSDADVSLPTRSAFTALVHAELAPLGDTMRHPLRVHFVRDTSLRGSYRRIAVLPQTATEPCVMVILVGGTADRDVVPFPKDRMIGTCGFFATFGLPGRGMEQWLLESRGALALSDVAISRERESGERFRFSGSNVLMSPETAACAAGNDSVCVTLWAEPDWSRRFGRLDAAYVEATRYTVKASPFGAQRMPGRHLADLRAAMTDGPFAQLWQSDSAPIAAYAALEGRSIAGFVRGRILEEVEPHRPGPLHADLALVLGLGIGIGAALLAFRFTKRRRS